MGLQRKTPLKRSWMQRKPRSTSYSRRPRDVDYMRLVKSLPCYMNGSGLCMGEVQADHAGDRAFGQKCPDNECIPLCERHHRQRTDGKGVFGLMTKEQRAHWRKLAIAHTQLAIAEKRTGLRR